MKRESEVLFALKQEALDAAATKAEGQHRKPTILDYQAEAESLGDRAKAEGVSWGPRVYADLSGGHYFKNYLFREKDLREAGPEFDNFHNFDGGIFDEPVWNPSTTAKKATGATFYGGTYDGMKNDDHVVLDGASSYFAPRGADGKELTNDKGVSLPAVRVINANGGSLTIGARAQVYGLEIEGSYAAVNIGPGANIRGFNATGAHIIELTAAPGATITNPQFAGATISMASQLQGSVWIGATDPKSPPNFKDANLTGCDFSGATLQNMRLTDCDMKGMNLSGARLVNFTVTTTVDGKPQTKVIRSAEELKAYGITADDKTSFSVTNDAPGLSNALNSDGLRQAGQTLQQNLDAAKALPQAQEEPQAPGAKLAYDAALQAGAALRSAVITPPDPALGVNANTLNPQRRAMANAIVADDMAEDRQHWKEAKQQPKAMPTLKGVSGGHDTHLADAHTTGAGLSTDAGREFVVAKQEQQPVLSRSVKT